MTAHRREVLRVVDLVAPHHPVVEGEEFEDCLLLGPAMVFLSGSTMRDCALPDPAVGMIVVPDSQESIVGAVAFVDCKILRCKFEGVGFVGPRAFIDKLRVSVMDVPR